MKTISPTSALPNITQPVVIDGYTQPGASVNAASKGTNAVLLIELSGANAGSANGLTLQASNSVIKGLVINRFTRGIAIGGSGSTVVSGNRVEGNFIGTDPSGTQDLGNTSDGMLVFRTTDSVIGGASREARNLVSGNGGTGIGLGSAAAINRIEGNLVGTTATASGDLGNSFSGVGIGSTNNTSNNTVGGTSAVSANTIAFNGRDGVTVSGNDSSVGNGILRNFIFSNDGLGIDLAAFGVTGPTPNDAGDSDSGPNGLQNKPQLTEAVTTADSTIIEGALASKPDTSFTIRFFSNVGDSEGRRFIGQRSVTTNATGNKRFTFSPATTVPTGQFVTATATGEEGTSEFSPTRFVVAP